MYRTLRIVFMGLGIAEVHEEPIPEELGDMPIVALDHVGTYLLIGTHDIPPVFRVELRCELRRFHHVAEHDGEVTAFSLGYTRGHDRRGWVERVCVLGQRRWDRRGRRRRCFDGPC